MRHDLLCSNATVYGAKYGSQSQTECYECDLIARARNDERQAIKVYVSRLKPRNRIWILRSVKRKELYWNLGIEWAIDVILNHPRIAPKSSTRTGQS